jgi:hypothetical protein
MTVRDDVANLIGKCRNRAEVLEVLIHFMAAVANTERKTHGADPFKFLDDLNAAAADALTILDALAANQPAPAAYEALRQNMADNWAAFTAMRNDINEIIGDMPSTESTLLHGPEMQHECTAVVEAVRKAFKPAPAADTGNPEPADGPWYHGYREGYARAQADAADTGQAVAWRWKPKGSSTWRYDPDPEWLRRAMSMLTVSGYIPLTPRSTPSA